MPITSFQSVGSWALLTDLFGTRKMGGTSFDPLILYEEK